MSARPRFVLAPCAVVAPVPPCSSPKVSPVKNSLKPVVSPEPSTTTLIGITLDIKEPLFTI
jgi:hypothetical protein